jgi:pimeloyl-ACP methyl ester carboxylesterase
VLVAALAEASERDYWQEWVGITCPVLVVRGKRGWMPGDATRRMIASLPTACLVEMKGAGHDVVCVDVRPVP